jgi:phage anti-repressor protein
MGKTSIINELTNRLAASLRHKIGSIVNENEFYANKYAKDAEVLLNEAREVAAAKNWNRDDRQEIKRQLRIKLEKELREKEFIDNKKFEIMDEEIDKTLKELGLS